jgi:arylsulfatase A-like enzyme
VAEHLKALYYAEITGLDRALGWFLAEVSLSSDVAVVVTSDHGESLGEHELYFKHGPNVFPGDVRVPLAVQAPGWRARVSDALVRTIDIPGTILSVLAVDGDLPPESGDLTDWIEGGAGLPVFGVATQPWGAMAEQGYRCATLQRVLRLRDAAFVETPWQGKQYWYDRTNDPDELRASVPVSRERADSLSAALERWIDDAVVTSGNVMDPGLREKLRSLGYAE